MSLERTRLCLLEATAPKWLTGRGIIIKEALKTQSVLRYFTIIGTTRIQSLKETSIQVAFAEDHIDALATKLKSATKPSWYSALWNKKKSMIIYSDRILTHLHPKGSV